MHVDNWVNEINIEGRLLYGFKYNYDCELLFYFIEHAREARELIQSVVNCMNVNHRLPLSSFDLKGSPTIKSYNMDYFRKNKCEVSAIIWDAGELDSTILNNFPNLTKLDCSFNCLKTLKGIESCTQLLEIDCSYNGLVTLEDLKFCTRLQKIHCRYGSLDNLKGIEACTKLIEIDCSHHKLFNLKGIEACTLLRKLNCSHNKLSNLEELKSCAKLEELYCHSNNLNSLKGIESCILIRELYCYANNLKSICELKLCVQLQKLYCYDNNQIASLKGLESCAKLQKLHCYSDRIPNLEGLKWCSQLQELVCHRDPATNVRELKACTWIKDVSYRRPGEIVMCQNLALTETKVSPEEESTENNLIKNVTMEKKHDLSTNQSNASTEKMDSKITDILIKSLMQESRYARKSYVTSLISWLKKELESASERGILHHNDYVMIKELDWVDKYLVKDLADYVGTNLLTFEIIGTRLEVKLLHQEL